MKFLRKLDAEIIVAVIRFNNQIRYFRSDRQLWVLDQIKQRNEILNKGYNLPELDSSNRFGIPIVNENSAVLFIKSMSEFEIPKDHLSLELAQRYTSARSWWDVGDLFPIIFVDFDSHEVAGFYPGGIPMERYVPDGWKGTFIDFATEYPEHIYPEEEKFWIKKGCDLLQLLNERGSKL